MGRRLGVTILAAATLAAWVWVAIPMALVQPFGPQTPGGLAIAYALRTRGSLVPALLLLVGLACAAALRRRVLRWWGRSLVFLALLLLAGAAVLGRANYFEWMFRPVSDPRFIEADRASDVQDADLVLGVAAGDAARAYPIREMAYHHVVNDVVGEEPIVATY